MSNNLRFIFTGGPGVGKTAVLESLSEAGYTCVPEVARKIIQDRRDQGLPPRPSPKEFARSIFAADIAQYDAQGDQAGPIFFDRGLVDALGMVCECGDLQIEECRGVLTERPLERAVFFFPPWQEIHAQDDERDQSFEDCLAISARIKSWYNLLGFELVEVPTGPLSDRVAFVLTRSKPRDMS